VDSFKIVSVTLACLCWKKPLAQGRAPLPFTHLMPVCIRRCDFVYLIEFADFAVVVGLRQQTHDA
jgi:hypothetical protein